jgi:septal ring factor EnvC (AmiA/AmiB activator)
MQRILLAIIAAAAVAGWIAAFYASKSSGEMEERLTASKAEISAVSEKLTNTQNRLRLQRDAAGSLEEIGERIGSVQAEAAALTGQIKTRTSELQALQQKIGAGETEIASVTRQIEAKRSALASLAQDVEAARAELDRLQSEQHEVVSQSPTTGSAVGSTPQAPATPKAVSEPSTPAKTTAKATKTQESDLLTDARRRFARIDQDGDGRFDRLDFRLKSVSLFGMVDANEDDYLTLDETLLSPEAFQKFDSDGDGKISSLEMADRRGFSVMDADRDEFVTFEEYVKFLRVGPE